MEEKESKEQKSLEQNDPEAKLISQSPGLNKLIKSLPNEGIITFDSNTLYWYIKLAKEWQDSSESIAKLAFDVLKDRDEYLKSLELCKNWSLMVTDTDPIIHITKPPSIAGFHISLDKKANDNNKPKQLIEGANVSFTINNIKLCLTMRPCPQNIDGQFTSNDGLRYYPTLWILADIQFSKFTYNTKYSPHIALACVAVQLSVAEVDKLKSNQLIKTTECDQSAKISNESISTDEEKINTNKCKQNEPNKTEKTDKTDIDKPVKSSKDEPDNFQHKNTKTMENIHKDFHQIYPEKHKDVILDKQHITEDGCTQETKTKQKRVSEVEDEEDEEVKPPFKKQKIVEIETAITTNSKPDENTNNN